MKRYTLLMLLLACHALASDGLLLTTFNDPEPNMDESLELGNNFATASCFGG